MLKFLHRQNCKILSSTLNARTSWRNVSYEQGQSPQIGIREYFYFIDHQGMLFLDDSRMKNFTSCFKDKVFLEFFFKRLRLNTTDRYQKDFPYLSICGRERNFVRCDDYPIVFTHVKKDSEGHDIFCYNHAGDLLNVKFMPEKIFMSPDSGRVYHPAPEIVGSVGLVRSKLAIEFSQFFQFRDGEHESPTHFTWQGVTYELSPEWFYEASGKKHVNVNSR
ncbi:hypothetical protein R5R35_007878 [Gryllus longicercus]|uniref:Uncharacterized protein n=1 Tax=Gryllus longicercus TaxID=2509291 RepID=A0AAN9V8S9_9ORTH